MNESEALVALNSASQVGPVRVRLMLRHFGSALDALHASPTDWAELPGFNSKVIKGLADCKTSDAWREDLEEVTRKEVTLIPFTDPRYPKRLGLLPDAPVVLYAKGTLLPNDARSLAVVGTRAATIYGTEMTRQLSSDLARQGYTIVSGLARGIDTAAHQATLNAGGRTLAVIGSGLSKLYPKENEHLATHIANQGAVISEFPMLTPPDRQQFPQRNRIVSGLSLGIVLIEAPEQSGALITVEKALSQGQRAIFALPGRADTPHFRGNHALLKGGKALLIESAQDIASHFGELLTKLPTANAIPLEAEERQLFDQMPDQELAIDELLADTKLPISKLNVLLMSLVLKRAVKEFPGKIYKKVIIKG